MDLQSIAKILLAVGFIMILAGGLVYLGSRLGITGLPGDIHIKKGNMTISFPIVTSIVLSLVLTLVLNFFFRR